MSLHDDWLTAWTNHDADALTSLLADDGTYELVPTARVFTRATGVESPTILHDIASDFVIKVIATQEAGDRYTVEWELTGTNDGPIRVFDAPASGRSFTIRGISTGQSEAGKIKEHRDYWDLYSWLVQLGMSESPEVPWRLAVWSAERAEAASERS